MNTPPEYLNGYPVMRSRPMEGLEHRVMVYRESHPVHQYVVAYWWPSLGSAWQSGHYYAEESDAVQDYMGR